MDDTHDPRAFTEESLRVSATVPAKRFPLRLFVPIALVIAFVGLVTGIGAYLAVKNDDTTDSRIPPEEYRATSFKGLQGTVPRLSKADDSWQTLTDSELGLAFRYPESWTPQQAESPPRVVLYPPGWTPDTPAPVISITFWSETVYDDQPESMASIESITVSGIEGVYYEDSTFRVPRQLGYVDVPYRGGVLSITASMGPDINLIPQMREIIGTIQLDY